MARRKTASLGFAYAGVISRAAPPGGSAAALMARRKTASLGFAYPGVISRAAPPGGSAAELMGPRKTASLGFASPGVISRLLRLAAPQLRSEADGEFHQVAEQEGVLPRGLGGEGDVGEPPTQAVDGRGDLEAGQVGAQAV